jgi:DNA-binding XRE family transcriptional regulator
VERDAGPETEWAPGPGSTNPHAEVYRTLIPGMWPLDSRPGTRHVSHYMPPIDAADPKLAAAIRALRNAKGATQEDIAFAAGITSSSYSRIERGLTNPAWTTVQRIADGLGVTIVELAEAVERARD